MTITEREHQRAADARRPRFATAVAPVIGGGALIWTWWLAVRLLVREHRPELWGARGNGDVARPQPGAVLVCGTLAVLGLTLAVVLVGTLRRARAGGMIAGLLAAVALLGGTVRILQTEPALRCSFDGYTEATTCVSGRDATRFDLATLLGPGTVAVLCIAGGARRRAERDLGREVSPSGDG